MGEIRTELDPHAQGIEDAKSGSSAALVPPAADAALIALERQFSAAFAELLALERLRNDRNPPGGKSTSDEFVTRQIEMILARLDPIERAIMQTQARTIAGLGVKARHAAHVMSQYWEDPLEQIDWDAQAARLLIDAVCDVARTPLPFRHASDNDDRATHRMSLQGAAEMEEGE
ncbi:hypothetical protein [Bradyrhizobium sp. STM 3557]|uniref:hypothetical protein n=1 Tax=Bradyrhizobium sp. STM 3557 TaxID=578920 RepID=UPI00388DB456